MLLAISLDIHSLLVVFICNQHRLKYSLVKFVSIIYNIGPTNALLLF
jgi:hypothetical protein